MTFTHNRDERLQYTRTALPCLASHHITSQCQSEHPILDFLSTPAALNPLNSSNPALLCSGAMPPQALLSKTERERASTVYWDM